MDSHSIEMAGLVVSFIAAVAAIVAAYIARNLLK
jgi:hypothetical protein